jgi:Domain of unknown function (DUF5666)
VTRDVVRQARLLLIRGSFVAVSLLAACAAPTPQQNADKQPGGIRPADVVLPTERDSVGRVGPDGGPLLVDRGIGGTGAPADAALQVAERGIGGTGIVGVVTGFGSVFVNGMEIGYDASAPVDIDGSASSAAALRAGQLVAIQAEGPVSAPYARTISVRSAVAGRIEALELGSGMLTIGGQSVLVPEGTWGANRFGLGDWVKVSGLRRADGTIVASRLDAAPVGALVARGKVVREGDVARVGNLVLPGQMAAAVKDGQYVVVSGDYVAGKGRVGTIAPDTLLPNPGDYFGAAASHLIVQAFVQVNKGSVSMNGVKVSAGPVVSGQASHDGIAVVSLERGKDGSYSAVELRYAGYRGQTERPFRRGTGTRTSDASQASQRNAHATATTSSQQDGNGRLASAAFASDPDSLAGSSGSAVSSLGTSSAITVDPIVTPVATDASAMLGAKVDASSKTTTVSPLVVAPPIITPVPPISPPPITPPVAPPVAPPTGPPTVEGGLGQISSTGGDGTTNRWAAERARHAAARHMHELSNAVTLGGSTSGATLNMLAGAVTSVTIATEGTPAPRAPTPGSITTGSITPVSVSAGKTATMIGATSSTIGATSSTTGAISTTGGATTTRFGAASGTIGATSTTIGTTSGRSFIGNGGKRGH